MARRSHIPCGPWSRKTSCLPPCQSTGLLSVKYCPGEERGRLTVLLSTDSPSVGPTAAHRAPGETSQWATVRRGGEPGPGCAGQARPAHCPAVPWRGGLHPSPSHHTGVVLSHQGVATVKSSRAGVGAGAGAGAARKLTQSHVSQDWSSLKGGTNRNNNEIKQHLYGKSALLIEFIN